MALKSVYKEMRGGEAAAVGVRVTWVLPAEAAAEKVGIGKVEQT